MVKVADLSETLHVPLWTSLRGNDRQTSRAEGTKSSVCVCATFASSVRSSIGAQCRLRSVLLKKTGIKSSSQCRAVCSFILGARKSCQQRWRARAGALLDQCANMHTGRDRAGYLNHILPVVPAAYGSLGFACGRPRI